LDKSHRVAGRPARAASPSLSHSHTLSLYLSLSHTLSLSLSHSHTVAISFSHTRCRYLSHTRTLSLSRSIYLSLVSLVPSGRSFEGQEGRSAAAKPSNECGTHKTVKARLWPWLSGKRPQPLPRCSLFARERWATCAGSFEGRAGRWSIGYRGTSLIRKRPPP